MDKGGGSQVGSGREKKRATCGPQPFSCFCGPSYLAYGLNSEYVAPVPDSPFSVKSGQAKSLIWERKESYHLVHMDENIVRSESVKHALKVCKGFFFSNNARLIHLLTM